MHSITFHFSVRFFLLFFIPRNFYALSSGFVVLFNGFSMKKKYLSLKHQIYRKLDLAVCITNSLFKYTMQHLNSRPPYKLISCLSIFQTIRTRRNVMFKPIFQVNRANCMVMLDFSIQKPTHK